MTTPAATWYTYRGAAVRVDRSTRSIKRWVREGLSAGWDEEGRRIIREDQLLAELRRRLAADPVHQQRVRKLMGDTPMGEWS